MQVKWGLTLRGEATALVGLYHQRWEHESAYYALRHTIMNGHNLRSGDPAGIEQEMWSLLTLYQAVRTVMVDAAESLPGTDPDRCCFSIALHTARDQVIQATGIVTADSDRDTLLGTIGRRILTGLLPPRRQRVSTRKVKSPMSRYSERHADGRPDTSRTVTHLDATVLEPVDQSPTPPTAGRPACCPCRAAPTPHPGPASEGPHTSLATPRNRRPLRRYHPGDHVQTTEPLGRQRPRPQARPRPLRRNTGSPAQLA